MKKLLAFQLEEGETLCNILHEQRHLSIQLMIHKELPGGLHVFEERPPQQLDLPIVPVTAKDIANWESAARSRSSRKSIYDMRGSVDPTVDIYPFPPHMIFNVGGVISLDLKTVWDHNNADGECLYLYHGELLVAVSGPTMRKWALRKDSFVEFTTDPFLVKGVFTVLKFLDEKLYELDEEEAA